MNWLRRLFGRKITPAPLRPHTYDDEMAHLSDIYTRARIDTVDLSNTVTADDVVWVCQLNARLCESVATLVRENAGLKTNIDFYKEQALLMAQIREANEKSALAVVLDDVDDGTEANVEFLTVPCATCDERVTVTEEPAGPVFCEMCQITNTVKREPEAA